MDEEWITVDENRINIDAEKKKDEKWMETGRKWKYRACVKWLYKNGWAGIKQN